jgi:sugar phosphate isomerase/epimerase
MRIGTTSYIFPADIITNARKLSGKVSDIEIVLFESDEDGSNLPDASVVSELQKIASEHDLTYTIHLPLDAYLADERPFLESALRVISITEKLKPHGYVTHLDARDRNADMDRLVENSLRSLEFLIRKAVPAEQLCVENLENHPAGFIDAILCQTWVSCCVDIGHLWKQSVDPIPRLEAWLPRARVVHLHGVEEYDHRRLSLMPPEKLDPVVDVLRRSFTGVLTLEIFSEKNLWDSMKTLQESLNRVAAGKWGA